MIHLKTKYIDEKAFMSIKQYADGQKAIIFTGEEGEPLLKATVNLAGDGIIPNKGNVIIYEAPHNEGILQALIDNHIVSAPLATYDVGYNKQSAHECQLLVQE